MCGKGAQAAAITGLIRDVLRVMVLDGRPLARAIELLNRTMVEQHDDGRFCTIAAALVSRAPDGYLDAELCLAGHDSPVLLRPDCSTEFVGGGGTAVGLLDVMRLDTTTIRLAPGDTLVFYTDGVTERRRGTGTVTPDHLYGHERLRTELSALAGRPPAALAPRTSTRRHRHPRGLQRLISYPADALPHRQPRLGGRTRGHHEAAILDAYGILAEVPAEPREEPGRHGWEGHSARGLSSTGQPSAEWTRSYRWRNVPPRSPRTPARPCYRYRPRVWTAIRPRPWPSAYPAPGPTTGTP